MSDIKWIKLTVDVFDDEKFDIINMYPNRNDIQLVWIKLLCLAGKCNECGLLVIASEIPYTDEMLADRFNMDMDTIKEAMEVFQKLRMIEIVDNAYMVSNWARYQNVEKLEEKKAKDRERQKKHREKQKGNDLPPESKEKSNFSSTNSTEKGNIPSINSAEKSNIPSINSTENVKKKSFDTRTNVENLDYVIENKLHDNINCIVEHEEAA